MKPKVLVVEDDRNILRLVTYNLAKADIDGVPAVTGEEGLQVLRQQKFDLVVLDIMLPGMDGFELCRTVKADSKLRHIPILMLTARGEEVDRVVGLELGADDYMVKPFSPRELVLAILRRGKKEETADERPPLVFKSLKIDFSRHEVLLGNKKVVLTLVEFNLLALLLERKGRVQTRERLLTDVWNLSADVSTRTIDTHIRRLRRKLGPVGKSIETIRGLGYRFNAEG
jgi:DNA-binding response OmpR family regulator